MRTSFHHQPEAQHPTSAIQKYAGRLPHLMDPKRTFRRLIVRRELASEIANSVASTIGGGPVSL